MNEEGGGGGTAAMGFGGEEEEEEGERSGETEIWRRNCDKRRIKYE